MKDNSIAPNVSRVGSFTESKFGIASNDDLVYIFDILRNKLYSDKALAVVREYTTNAADANTENNLPDRPIHVTVPSRMNPVFKVRDFGKGLTEDEIRNIYCMYGRSTKRNSNAFTGQLGLGSKSGFAYGDSFSVTSFIDGVKTIYSAYIDETKLGSIAKIHSQNTNEENGIEISIPVNSSDIEVFRDKIANTLRFFKIKPIINGDVKIEDDKSCFSGKFWRVNETGSKNNSWNNNNGFKNAVAVMGNIGYPIDTSLVYPEIKHYWQDNKPEGYKFITGNVVINFDIGELSIAASREELEYNAVTIKAIKNKAKLAYNELISSMNNELSLASDGILARVLLSRVKNFTGVGAWGDIENKVTWNGKNLKGTIVPCSNKIGLKVDSYVFSSSSNKTIRTPEIGTINVNKDLMSNDVMWYIESDEDYKLYGAKMSQMTRKNPSKTFYLFKISKGKTSNGDDFDGNSWFEESSFPKSYVKKLSTYELDKKEKKTVKVIRRKRGQVTVYSLINSPKPWGTQADNWTEKLVNTKDIAFYVPINKFKIVKSGGVERSIDIIESLKDACNYFKINLPQFYGVKLADIKKLNNSENIFDYVNKTLESNSKFQSAINSVAIRSLTHRRDILDSCPLIFSVFRLVDSNRIINKDSPLNRFVELLQKCDNDKSITDYDKVNILCDICSISKEKYSEEMFGAINKTVKEVNEKYPIIRYMTFVLKADYEEVLEHIYEYVNFIDSNK